MEGGTKEERSKGEQGPLIWVVVKIMLPFGSLLEYGTYYLGYPNKDHNFDNHPYACCCDKPHTWHLEVNPMQTRSRSLGI